MDFYGKLAYGLPVVSQISCCLHALNKRPRRFKWPATSLRFPDPSPKQSCQITNKSCHQCNKTQCANKSVPQRPVADEDRHSSQPQGLPIGPLILIGGGSSDFPYFPEMNTFKTLLEVIPKGKAGHTGRCGGCNHDMAKPTSDFGFQE